ncbi:hypothetical protein CYMTET_5081 [Cymbomonas tetramitiformis]|uniref:Uncharacterized protein n=1 Tax=Cymbomonas tetramitiformis TaxID=36881 RepID=A0AAE0GZV1_9CHLO|nr:hypothetical protein CYMTET_5081 [Cymbomonas tetramitiformis]
MDPNEAIMDFNAALAAAKRKNTLDEDDVKGQFIQAMDRDYYSPVVSRLLLHDQRVAETLLAIQQWARECHAAHVRAGAAVPKSAAVGSNMLPARFGDPPGGHTSADNDVMEILLALRKEDVEGDFYAFQHAIDSNDTDRFDALCYLAGGRPVMLEDLSAASFCVGDTVAGHAIDEYLECCQPADTRFGVYLRAPPAAPQSAVSDEGMYPVSALHAHELDVSFMERFAVRLDLTDPNPPLAMHCMGPMAPVDSVSVAGEDSEDDDEGLPPPRQALGCGRPPLGFGNSALTSLAVCMRFIVCAAAVPSAASAFGGVSMGADAAPPVGGVVHGYPEMLLATTTAFRTPTIDDRGLGSTPNYPTHDLSAAPEHTDDEVGGAGVLSPAAIPPFKYWQPRRGGTTTCMGGTLAGFGTPVPRSHLWLLRPFRCRPHRVVLHHRRRTVSCRHRTIPHLPQTRRARVDPLQSTTTPSALSHFALRMIHRTVQAPAMLRETVVPALLDAVTVVPALPGAVEVANAADGLRLTCLQFEML